MSTLKERIVDYESNYDFKLIKKLPLVINLNGRSFKKNTSLLPKPYSTKFFEAICSSVIKLASEIDGTVFVYSFNDEIIIISKNNQTIDTEMWYDGNLQKINSAAASIATLSFYKAAEEFGLNIIGDPTFISKSFVVPSISEVVNFLIYKQHQAYYSAVSFSCFYELSKKFDIDYVNKILLNTTIDDKIDILLEKCDIDFNDYPIPFRKGIGCYRIPKLVKKPNGENELKNKLFIDLNLPSFNKNQEFLYNILK